MMDTLMEKIDKLDVLYKEYQPNRKLSSKKTDNVVLLLAQMSVEPNSNTAIIAEQLSRFSAKICQMYFDNLTKTIKPDIAVIDDLLRDFLKEADNSKQPQHYVYRFADTIVPIIKNYKEDVFKSKVISSLVAFIAQYAIKSNNSKEIFRNSVNKTDGALYLLDYSGIKKNLMNNIWTVTNNVFEDLSKSKYEPFIVEWGKKYGYIEEDAVVRSVVNDKSANTEATSTETLVKASEPTEINTALTDSRSNLVSNGFAEPSEKKQVPDFNKNAKNAVIDSSTVSQKESSSEINTQDLYINLKRDISKEQETIIIAFADMIAPISKAVDSISSEINKSHEVGAENIELKKKIKDLEYQLSEQRLKLQDADRTLMTVKTENDKLKQQISELEKQNSELDGKLSDAYKINSRESSLEADKIRSDLKKSFTFLYEDWLEYEFSDVSENNYESLQAIIKKVFRSLERNGIDFKGE